MGYQTRVTLVFASQEKVNRRRYLALRLSEKLFVMRRTPPMKEACKRLDLVSMADSEFLVYVFQGLFALVCLDAWMLGCLGAWVLGCSLEQDLCIRDTARTD